MRILRPCLVLSALLLTMVSRCAAAATEPVPAFDRVPGVVIAHSPKSTRVYLGSAGIAKLSDGSYLAKHDEFGPGSTEKTNAVTKVYRSTNRGETWELISRVEGQFWANLFEHQGAVYMMGTTASHRSGHATIRRSLDGGRTWTEPKGPDSGLLFPDIAYHTAPMPIVIHNGLIWRAMEDEKGGESWCRMFRAFMLSAPVDADLLKASSWTASNALGHDPSYLGGRFGGWLEGNAVVAPDGQIVNILRTDFRDVPEKASIVRISADGQTATFDPERDFIDFPGGCKKFVIRRDPTDGRYWTLANAILPQHAGGNVERIRNAAVLMSSTDLRTWTPHYTALHHPDLTAHGFQYLDWLFEGDDLIVVSRTAYEDGVGGAYNQHNSNFLTFHRIKDYRQHIASTVAVAGR